MSDKLDFDLDAMKLALKKCDENIKIFEQAIMKEMNTKMEYQRIIRYLEEKVAQEEYIKKQIKVEVVHEDLDDIDGD